MITEKMERDIANHIRSERGAQIAIELRSTTGADLVDISRIEGKLAGIRYMLRKLEREDIWEKAQ